MNASTSSNVHQCSLIWLETLCNFFKYRVNFWNLRFRKRQVVLNTWSGVIDLVLMHECSFFRWIKTLNSCSFSDWVYFLKEFCFSLLLPRLSWRGLFFLHFSSRGAWGAAIRYLLRNFWLSWNQGWWTNVCLLVWTHCECLSPAILSGTVLWQ